MRLGTFLDLGYLVRHQSVRLAVYGLGRFLVRGFREAEDLALLSHPTPWPYLRITRVWAAMSPRRWFFPEISTVMKATK
jgi:hypothetical protein